MDERAVYVTRHLADRRMVDVLERGACVVAHQRSGPPLELPLRGLRDKLVERNGESPRQTIRGRWCTIIRSRGRWPRDGWCDDGWCYLLDGAEKHFLETAPARPDVIIRALPTHGAGRRQRHAL